MPTRMLLLPHFGCVPAPASKKNTFLFARAGPSSLPPVLLLFPSSHKDVVRDDVPGVVNADEEQEQRRGAHEEQGRARMGVSGACRHAKECVCRERKPNMKQPVLEHGLVDG